jgi:endonuclease III
LVFGIVEAAVEHATVGHTSPFARVREVTALLDAAYPHTRLGNKRKPLDELVYIILSIQTGENLYQEVYRLFKERFPRWNALLAASVDDIASAISLGGLSQQKARHLKAIALRLRADFGRVTLRPVGMMDTEAAERYLCSLPGVGIKTARCVLMYAFDHPVFPADLHCLRVMTRLGWIDWHGQRAERLADKAQDGVPSELRSMLHIRLVQHGRAVCRVDPRCPVCVLNSLCPSARVSQEEGKGRD